MDASRAALEIRNAGYGAPSSVEGWNSFAQSLADKQPILAFLSMLQTLELAIKAHKAGAEDHHGVLSVCTALWNMMNSFSGVAQQWLGPERVRWTRVQHSIRRICLNFEAIKFTLVDGEDNSHIFNVGSAVVLQASISEAARTFCSELIPMEEGIALPTKGPSSSCLKAVTETSHGLIQKFLSDSQAWKAGTQHP